MGYENALSANENLSLFLYSILLSLFPPSLSLPSRCCRRRGVNADGKRERGERDGWVYLLRSETKRSDEERPRVGGLGREERFIFDGVWVF